MKHPLFSCLFLGLAALACEAGPVKIEAEDAKTGQYTYQIAFEDLESLESLRQCGAEVLDFAVAEEGAGIKIRYATPTAEGAALTFEFDLSSAGRPVKAVDLREKLATFYDQKPEESSRLVAQWSVDGENWHVIHEKKMEAPAVQVFEDSITIPESAKRFFLRISAELLPDDGDGKFTRPLAQWARMSETEEPAFSLTFRF